MIDKKDVIRLKIPFPNIDSGLALKSHMYICKKNVNYDKELIKCQTFKPKLIFLLKNFLKEDPNSLRNPFKNTTIIDLDKIFKINKVIIPLELKTDIKSKVSEDLYNDLLSKCKNPDIFQIDNMSFVKINYKCNIVK